MGNADQAMLAMQGILPLSANWKIKVPAAGLECALAAGEVQSDLSLRLTMH